MRRLPNGKQISALGFGCSSLWSRPAFPEDEAQNILRTAVAGGINHFDTSPSYGPAHAERRLGLFLKGADLGDFAISTKVGTNFLDGRIVRGFSTDMISRSFDESLQRLGVPHVDILYLHGPNPADLTEEVFEFFSRLKAQGRITYSGVNSFDAGVLESIPGSPIDAVMLQYNVGDLSAASLIDRLHDAGKIVISGTAMARAKFALSTFFPRDRGSAWYLLRMLRHDPLFWWEGTRLARRLKRTGKTPAEAAIQFVTGHPHILSNLFGTSRAEHVVENVRAGHGALAETELASLLGAVR